MADEPQTDAADPQAAADAQAAIDAQAAAAAQAAAEVEAEPPLERQCVEALWVGPYRGRTPDGIMLIPGETVYDNITEGEASASEHWLYPVPQVLPLAKRNKDELLALATERGVEVPQGITKPELVTLLSEPGGAD